MVFNSSVTVTGTLTVDAPSIDLNSPLVAGTLIGNATTINVGGTGQIQQAIDWPPPPPVSTCVRETTRAARLTSTKSITLSPGPTTGRVNIIGSLILDANDTLALQVDGGNPDTQYDSFSVLGLFRLAAPQPVRRPTACGESDADQQRPVVRGGRRFCPALPRWSERNGQRCALTLSTTVATATMWY